MSATLAYIIHAHKDAPVYLCVQDDETKEFHRFELSIKSCSRLAAECASIVNGHLGGYQKK